MRDWTDGQFREAGWSYVLRYKGRAMACTISAFDAASWERDGIGEVTNLRKTEAKP